MLINCKSLNYFYQQQILLGVINYSARRQKQYRDFVMERPRAFGTVNAHSPNTGLGGPRRKNESVGDFPVKASISSVLGVEEVLDRRVVPFHELILPSPDISQGIDQISSKQRRGAGVQNPRPGGIGGCEVSDENDVIHVRLFRFASFSEYGGSNQTKSSTDQTERELSRA